MRTSVISIFLALAMLSVGFSANAVEPGAPDKLLGRMDAAAFKLQGKLSEPFKNISDAERRERGAMAEFYAENGYTFLWIDENGIKSLVKEVAEVFSRARKFDLRAANYPLPDLRDFSGAQDQHARWLANVEYRITRSVLAYVRHAQSGHVNPRSISRNLDITPNAPDPVAVLNELARRDIELVDYLESFHPQGRQFAGMLKRLNELRKISQRNRVKIPPGDVIEPGQTHPHVKLVRERLGMVEGDQTSAYDEALVGAIKKFQKKNGLHVDGLIGPATRRALNLDPSDKIDTLRVNLERWRWLPNDLGERYVRVNIPEFMVRVVDNGKTTFKERIVVGKPRHATPSFSDKIEYVVFNPYWNVPYSITKNEIVPIARRNPGFLERKNIKVIWRGSRTVDPYQVDWQRVDLRKVRLRQSPGSNNALGKIKFMFPNKHSVYLHDTPSKHLFRRSRRAFSHGCMRVRNPDRFAEALMRQDGWDEGDISRAIARGRNRTVRLKSAVPVHLTYMTAAVSEAGGVQFFADIYRYDARVLKTLNAAQRVDGS